MARGVRFGTPPQFSHPRLTPLWRLAQARKSLGEKNEGPEAP